jgi:hypothetical protein
VAVVLRLLPEALAEGRVVGHAEIVDTGERKPIRSAQELVEVLCALTPDSGSPASRVPSTNIRLSSGWKPATIKGETQ